MIMFGHSNHCFGFFEHVVFGSLDLSLFDGYFKPRKKELALFVLVMMVLWLSSNNDLNIIKILPLNFIHVNISLIHFSEVALSNFFLHCDVRPFDNNASREWSSFNFKGIYVICKRVFVIISINLQNFKIGTCYKTF